jgi:hypothetical protein
MWSNNTFFWPGLFPFVPENRPNVFGVGGFPNEPPFSDYWLFPEEEEANQVGTPVGPMTGFPVLLNKNQLAWFIYKVKTWSVTASASYDFVIESGVVQNQYQGSFQFNFVLGRNISDSGEEITEQEFGDPEQEIYTPDEKSLLRSIGVGAIPLIPNRAQSVTYTETQTRFEPEEEPFVTTEEKGAVIKFSYFSDASFIEPLQYPRFAWAPEGEPIYDFGYWMRSNSRVACNLLVSAGAGNFFGAGSDALQRTGTYEFSSDYEVACNVVFNVPWEDGLSFPLYRLKEQADEAPFQFSDIVLTPETFWEYQPPL